MTDLVPPSAGALTLLTDEPDELLRLTSAWLLSLRSKHTRDAYRRDLRGWLAFCEAHDLDLLAATRGHGDAYCRTLEEGDRPASPATVARKLSAVSSWYAYLMDEQAVSLNPFVRVSRPRIDRDHSETVGLTEPEARALVAAADADTGPQALRTRALVRFMVEVGPRVSEVLALDMDSLGYDRGFRTVRIVGKGGKVRRRVLPPSVGAALDAYLQARADAAGTEVARLVGPLFASSTGGRLDRGDMYRLIRRIAKAAGLPQAEQISPHSLRHTFVTVARERGASLEDIQDSLGHADPRTTRRYDRARSRLERDPSQLVAAAIG